MLSDWVCISKIVKHIYRYYTPLPFPENGALSEGIMKNLGFGPGNEDVEMGKGITTTSAAELTVVFLRVSYPGTVSETGGYE